MSFQRKDYSLDYSPEDVTIRASNEKDEVTGIQAYVGSNAERFLDEEV